MGIKQRSHRGELVDFNLVKIKSQIQNNTKPKTVQTRETLIKEKISRKLQNVTKKLEEEKEKKLDDIVLDVPINGDVDKVIAALENEGVDVPENGPTNDELPRSKRKIKR